LEVDHTLIKPHFPYLLTSSEPRLFAELHSKTICVENDCLNCNLTFEANLVNAISEAVLIHSVILQEMIRYFKEKLE